MSRNDAHLAREIRRDLAALDRRGFLRLIGLAAAAGWLPAGCRAGSPDLAPPAELRLQALTPRTYAVLNAAARRIVGTRAAAAIEDGEIDPAARIDAFLASSPALIAPVQQALLALEFAMPPLSGLWPPFTGLADEQRDAVLDDLLRSRFALRRALFNGVRTFAVNGFYGSRPSRRLIHYPAVLGRGRPGIEEAMRWDEGDFPGPGRAG